MLPRRSCLQLRAAMEGDARWQAYVRETLEPRNAEESVFAWKCGRPTVHEQGACAAAAGWRVGGPRGGLASLVLALASLRVLPRRRRPAAAALGPHLSSPPCCRRLLPPSLPPSSVVDAEADMFQTELDFGSIDSEAFTRDVYQR